MKMIISNHLICHLFLLLYVSIRKKVVCHNCKLLRYFRNSTSVPCILLILTHLKGAVSNFRFDTAPSF